MKKSKIKRIRKAKRQGWDSHPPKGLLKVDRNMNRMALKKRRSAAWTWTRHWG